MSDEEYKFIHAALIKSHKAIWFTSMQFRGDVDAFIQLIPFLIGGMAERARIMEKNIKEAENAAVLDLSFPPEWRNP